MPQNRKNGMGYKSVFPFAQRPMKGSFHRFKRRVATILLLIPLLFVAASSYADKYSELLHSVSKRNGILHRVFQDFPLLTPMTNSDGRCRFQTLDVKEPIVSVEGVGFYGFRFKVPKRAKPGDFVWAFGTPRNGYNWFIIGENETMAGFEDYENEPRAAYEGLEHIFPTPGKEIVLQRLPGDELEDEKEYLIWFMLRKPKPSVMSVMFTFSEVQTKKTNLRAMEKTLGLKRKPKKPAVKKEPEAKAESPP